jgi:hypothetical protein
MTSTQDLIGNQEIQVFLMRKHMVLMFWGMEFILPMDLTMYMIIRAFDQMVWYVLNNCSEVDEYVRYVLITIFILL